VLSWLANRIISHTMARLREGDSGPILRLDAGDIRFRFPGESSWATEVHNRGEHARWLARFVETGLELYPDEVIAQGPPWRVTLCVRGRSNLDTEDGRVYENRYVIWGRVSWGRLREYEVYEDTQATQELDAYLARRASAAAA
jgi:ketosteroid isomerase-like protein